MDIMGVEEAVLSNPSSFMVLTNHSSSLDLNDLTYKFGFWPELSKFFF